METENKEKLTLKELAGYLPYRLNGSYLLSDVIHLSEGQKDETRNKILCDYSVRFFLLYCKPHLRPLSDLTKEIEHNGEKFLPFFRINEYTKFTKSELISVVKDNHWLKFRPCTMIEMLYEWHFDVFGLIKRDLAIDINTLQNE